MRILNIRFKNLNSLSGEWSVDFTHHAYMTDGIFAITGPTGAGKTTILDAICLALYGRTPRLGKVTKTSNEIMSRQTNECFAEVTFETLKGRFRCHWSQHRSRRKTDGELQPPKHEIVNADSSEVLESRLRDVAEYIEKTTGMDFDRFTRSMLLAQGGFAAFLQANPDERSPILEQITGTEIYSQISIKVHEFRSEERKKLELLEEKLSAICLLSEDEEQREQFMLQEKESHEISLGARLEILRKSLDWLGVLSVLEKDVAALHEQLRNFEIRQNEFQSEALLFERACKALALEGNFGHLSALNSQQDKEKKDLNSSHEKLPELKKAFSEALCIEEHTLKELEDAKSAFKIEADIIKKVREMDFKIAEKKLRVEASDKAINKLEVQKGDFRNQTGKIEKSLNKSQEDLKNIDTYLSEHGADSSLVGNLSAIGKMFDEIHERNEKHSRTKETLKSILKEKETAESVRSSIESRHQKLSEELIRTEQSHGFLIEEILSLLQGRETGDLRNDIDDIKERKHLLEQTRQTLDRIASANKSLTELKNLKEKLEIEGDRLKEEINAILQKKSDCQKEVVCLETQADLVKRIRSLEEERLRLEDGKPCPLCGASDHPFARGNIPDIDESESKLNLAKKELKSISDSETAFLIRESETAKDLKQTEHDLQEKLILLDSDRKNCDRAFADFKIDTVLEKDSQEIIEDELSAARKRISELSSIVTEAEKRQKKEKILQKNLDKERRAFFESEKSLQQVFHRESSALKDIERLGLECTELEDQYSNACGQVLQEVSIYGVNEISIHELGAIKENLTLRRNLWQEKLAQKAAGEKNIASLNTELEKNQALLEKLDEESRDISKVHDEMMSQFEAMKKERYSLYGEKNPDEVEKRLSGSVEHAEKALDKARKDSSQAKENVNNLNSVIISLSDSILKREKELRLAEQEFNQRIIQAGFRDKEDFLAACMPEPKRSELSKRAESLRKEQTEINTRLSDAIGKLKTEKDRKLSDQSSDVLQQDMDACKSLLKEAQHEIGAIRQRLFENEALRIRHKEQLNTMTAQKKECSRWDALHEIIGSADGKKYRNFAQGLTFEMMTAHANRQLQKMTSRYLLIRDDEKPLELNVIDSYQAGEIRSTKNLSGGESFIVSLALALGLSQMASRNVRVDSLFLDEGFGTLDEDALETALETLSGLHQDGKLIGVISHVHALKERIGTQIEVVPQSGGRSIITGPGCQKVKL